MEFGDWFKLTGKIVEQWRHNLEGDVDATHPRQWIGFYINGEEDATFVMKCVTDFSPQCMQLHNLSMPLHVQCFTVGTHSRCLREWEKPTSEWVGFFHEVKIIHIQYCRGR